MPALEEWRPIRGFEGLYDVSNRGEVRSLPREVQEIADEIYSELASGEIL